MKPPVVTIIGSGPGDPGLITVRGLERLRASDVVIYDHRIPKRLLEGSRPGAELIDVGDASQQTMAQEAINYLVAEKAREGRSVARLKWGDPFVFDHGGEEALFLREHGIPFEIVPGVPAAIGIPAYAGVPVTYPGGGDTLTFVRAYEDERRVAPKIDWPSLARLGGTVVCYANAQQLVRIIEALIDAGWSPAESAAVVFNGTLTSQETLSGTLLELLEKVRGRTRRVHVILVVGRVVGFREHMRWFDDRPLFGRRILVTRPRDQAAELSDSLALLGAEPIETPLIRIEPPDDPGPLLRAAAQAPSFDWIVFTSGNAVDAFMRALLDGERDVRALSGPMLCAVGPGTAERLARYGIKVDLVPREFRAEALVDAIAARGTIAGAQVLLPRADIGREIIRDQLQAAGARVTEVIAYRNVPEELPRETGPDVYRMLLDGTLDAVTFTSASAVRSFASVYGADQAADLLRRTVVASIGPVTTEAAAELGIGVHVQPSTYTIPALVDALAAHFTAASAT